MTAEFSSLTRALERQLTAAANVGDPLGAWGRLFSTLPNPDPVLRRMGKSIEILDEIRRENHVAACAESREAAVLKKKWALDSLEASPAAVATIEGGL